MLPTLTKAGTPRRRPGRKKYVIGPRQKVTTVMIPDDIETLRALGDGSLARGIQRAAEAIRHRGD